MRHDRASLTLKIAVLNLCDQKVRESLQLLGHIKRDRLNQVLSR